MDAARDTVSRHARIDVRDYCKSDFKYSKMGLGKIIKIIRGTK